MENILSALTVILQKFYHQFNPKPTTPMNCSEKGNYLKKSTTLLIFSFVQNYFFNIEILQMLPAAERKSAGLMQVGGHFANF